MYPLRVNQCVGAPTDTAQKTCIFWVIPPAGYCFILVHCMPNPEQTQPRGKSTTSNPFAVLVLPSHRSLHEIKPTNTFPTSTRRNRRLGPPALFTFTANALPFTADLKAICFLDVQLVFRPRSVMTDRSFTSTKVEPGAASEATDSQDETAPEQHAGPSSGRARTTQLKTLGKGRACVKCRSRKMVRSQE